MKHGYTHHIDLIDGRAYWTVYDPHDRVVREGSADRAEDAIAAARAAVADEVKAEQQHALDRIIYQRICKQCLRTTKQVQLVGGGWRCTEGDHG